MPILTDEQWWQYHQDGYIRLGKLIDGAELANLQQRIDDIMLGKVVYEGMFMQLDAGGAYENLNWDTRFAGARLDYRKIQDLERDPLFLRLMQRPVFREICDYHYGAHASISVFRSMFMNKPARKGTILPWHQDGGDGWASTAIRSPQSGLRWTLRRSPTAACRSFPARTSSACSPSRATFFPRSTSLSIVPTTRSFIWNSSLAKRSCYTTGSCTAAT